MSNQGKFSFPIFLTLFTMMPLIRPEIAWPATSINEAYCNENILDIGSATSSATQAKSDIRRTERWENARAIYERDLDFQGVEREQYMQDYTPKRDLIEAKYQLALAEGKLVTPNYDKQAIANLKQAQVFLGHAHKNINLKPQNQQSIQQIQDRVTRILRFVNEGQCWSNRLSDAFDVIDQNIERLLQTI